MREIIIVLVIFFLSYSLVVTEKVHRSIAVIIGSSLLLFFGIITQEQAVEFIDFNTIGLLVGMMLLVSVMRRSGIFEYLSVLAIKYSKGQPFRLLVLFSLVTAVLSALLDNVTTVLIIAPVTLALADAAKINPVPYLLAEVFSSNVGGTATLIGDPPNIIIGSAANLSFMQFILVNGPPVIVILIFYIYAINYYFRKEMADATHIKDALALFNEEKIIQNLIMIKRSLVVFSFTILLFLTHRFHGQEPATIALTSAFVLLLLTNVNPEEIFSEIEYSSIFFLIGIFILVGALEHEGILNQVAQFILSFTRGSLQLSTLVTIWFSALASAIVDNIPLTTLMIPIVRSINAATQATTDAMWWGLSLGACLGGNGALAGAAANIVVISLAKKNNVLISFWEFFKIGFPLMIVSVFISTLYVYVRFFLF